MLHAISVVLPVYNAETHLEEAIESILTQTFRDFELLIIDDGSTDSSASIILQFTDERIRILRNEKNIGLISTLNKGLEAAQGKYIARMDADDRALPTRLEKQYRYLEENQEVDILGTWFQIMGTDEIIKHPVDEHQCKVQLLRRTSVGHPTVMFRKASIDKFKLRYRKEALHAEDYQLWTEASMYGLKIKNLPEVLLTYRVHPSQISSAKSDEQNNTVRQIMLLYGSFYFKEYVLSNPNLYMQLLSYTYSDYKTYGDCKELVRSLLRHNAQKQTLSQKALQIFLHRLLINGALKVYVNPDNFKFDLMKRALVDFYFYRTPGLLTKIRFIVRSVF